MQEACRNVASKVEIAQLATCKYVKTSYLWWHLCGESSLDCNSGLGGKSVLAGTGCSSKSVCLISILFLRVNPPAVRRK